MRISDWSSDVCASDLAGPTPDDADELAADSSVVARLVTNPTALATVALVLLALWGAREALGPLAGGALSPAPDSAGSWWRLVTEGWHEIGQGHSAPSPAYLLPPAVMELGRASCREKGFK